MAELRSKIRLRVPQAGTLAVLQLLAVAARGGGGNPGPATASAAAAGLGLAGTAGGTASRVLASSSLPLRARPFSRYASVSRRPLSAAFASLSPRRTNAFLSRQAPGITTFSPRSRDDGVARSRNDGVEETCDRTSRSDDDKTTFRAGVRGSRGFCGTLPGSRSQDGGFYMNVSGSSRGPVGRSEGSWGNANGWSDWSDGDAWGQSGVRRMSYKPSSMSQASAAVPKTAEYTRSPYRRPARAPQTTAAPPPYPSTPSEGERSRASAGIAGAWGRRRVGESLESAPPAGSRNVQTIVQPSEAETLPIVSEDGDGEALYGDGEAVRFEGERGLGVNGYIPVGGERAEEAGQLSELFVREESSIPSGGGAEEAVDYGKLKVVDLKKLLKERGLKASGKKAELVERLRQHAEATAVGDVSTLSPSSSEASVSRTARPQVVEGGEDLLVPLSNSALYEHRLNGYVIPAADLVSTSDSEGEWANETRSMEDAEIETGMLDIQEKGVVPVVSEAPPTPMRVGANIHAIQVVGDRKTAREVVKVLMANPQLIFACDTEVADIDKARGPVGNGCVTCVSIYAGTDLDCGEGAGKILWVDNLGSATGTLDEFKPFFESEDHKKVWQNYGFDRHVLFNKPESYPGERIDCKGFGGDTMHMARLWDTSMEKSAGETGFSLEALSQKLLGDEFRKVPMKELFGVPKLRKDGTPGNVLMLPSVRDMQTGFGSREKFIEYSAYDAKVTWLVHRALMGKLREMEWKDGMNMLDFYDRYYVPFGKLLTDMERSGILVAAKDYLRDVEVQARMDKKQAEETFLHWVKRMQPGVETLNPSSTAQIQTLLFGGARNIKTGEMTPEQRVFKVERDQAEIENAMEGVVQDEYTDYTASMLKEKLKERGLKTSGRKADLLARIRGEEKPEIGAEFKLMDAEDLRHACQARGLDSDGTKAQLVRKLTEDTVMQLELQTQYRDSGKEAMAVSPKPKLGKYRDLTISSLGLKPSKFTDKGSPAVSIDVLRELAGNPLDDPPKYGSAYKTFGRGLEGKEACEALFALCSMGSVDTMVSNFLQPLQELVDENSRVHCSLNLNTETGRLSARKPNLQNQPALEKDQYKIRAAFRAEEGKKLVVADYGQLELRLLAHITDCKSMIEAFEQGGCFHSRTAMGMFDHVREAVERGEVLLEWDYSKGEPPKPLVKDVFGSERRKAKTLNFSIAYGKTAHGLSVDWGVSLKEAESLLQAWYADRPEVQRWQKGVIELAKKTGFSRTLMGRYRKLPDILSKERRWVGHGSRAAINTPIQGGAADVAMVAMIKLVESPLLQRLGWKLLLQIHDEVILEGPEESAEEAMEEVVRCMQEPWDGIGLKELRVKLAVDAKTAKTWYEAK